LFRIDIPPFAKFSALCKLKKNGSSTYYFANGDVEETIYVDGVLQGPAKYIYKDGVVEQYKYKDGKRIEN